MSLKKGSKFERGYATVIDEDGVNYRDIAETLTAMGYPMGHSSVRNYVIRSMVKFVNAISEKYDIKLNNDKAKQIALDPAFQEGMAFVLSIIESQRRDEEKNNSL